MYMHTVQLALADHLCAELVHILAKIGSRGCAAKDRRGWGVRRLCVLVWRQHMFESLAVNLLLAPVHHFRFFLFNFTFFNLRVFIKE